MPPAQQKNGKTAHIGFLKNRLCRIWNRRCLVLYIDLANRASAHLIELGGCRAVPPFTEMARKTTLLIREFLFIKSLAVGMSVNTVVVVLL